MRAAILVFVLATASAAVAQTPASGSFVPPDWLHQPSSDELRAAWPKDALAKGQGGRSVMQCEVEPQGTLAKCKVVSEEPAGQGFGTAALQLAPSMAFKPATQDGKPVAAAVSIPVAFQVPDPSTVVEPDWLKMPNSDDLQAVWPKAAMVKGQGGRAVIECDVEPQGTLENCKVISEEPAGMGFGAATLLLAPSFAMKPATRDGKPVGGKVRIPINFKLDSAVDDSSLESVLMVKEPIWDSAPSFDDMKAAWPAGAKADAGHVSMRCRLTREGTVRQCQVLTETPRGQGFGKAARTVVAPRFTMRIDPASADKIAKAYVNLAIHFNNPALNTPRAVVEPKWITGLDPAKAHAVYPAKAADAGVKSGKGYADCTVAPDGRLADCKPAGGVPDGMGFAEAAAAVASVMQMNPWTTGGGPVDGVRIRLPVAFNLAPDGPPAKP